MSVQKLRSFDILEQKVHERQSQLPLEDLMALAAILPPSISLPEHLLTLSSRPITYVLPQSVAEGATTYADAVMIDLESPMVNEGLSLKNRPSLGFWPIVDEYEAWEARCLELDGVVMAPGLQELHKLQWLIETCREATIEPILQIKNLGEFDLALETDAKFLLISPLDLDLDLAQKRLRRWGRGRLPMIELDESVRMDVGKLRALGYNCFYINAYGALPHELIAEKSTAAIKRSPHERRSVIQRFWG